MKANFLRETGRLVTNQSFTDGKTKMAPSEVIARWKKGVSLNHVELAGNENSAWIIAGFKEDANVYMNGGKALMDLVKNWLATDEIAGDIDVLNEMLAEEPVPINIVQVNLPDGRIYNKIVIK